MDKLVGWGDIVRGVGELVVDEAKVALHAIFDHYRHEPPQVSEHFNPRIINGGLTEPISPTDAA